MRNSLLFILVIVAFLAFVFFVLDRDALITPEGVDNAEKADRCAEFRTMDEEDESVYSLGYKGRIQQLLHGCF